MDDVFNDAFEDGKETAGERLAAHVPPVETAETVEQPAQVEQPQGSETNPESATTAQEQSKHVPLAALEAERKGRQDWKEKAIRFEAELNAVKAAQQSQQPVQQQQPVSLEDRVQQQLLHERFNMSHELMAANHPDLDEYIQVFTAEAEKNPGLAAQLMAHRHPVKFAYQEGKRLKAMAEVGDPTEFEAKIRAKILAELQATQAPAPAPAAPAIPQSLASARSSASRSAPAFTGPTPIQTLFDN